MAGRGQELRGLGASVLYRALIIVGHQVLAAGSALTVGPGDVSIDLVAAGPLT